MAFVFKPSDSRIVITLGVAGFFLCFTSAFFLSNIPQVDFHFPVDKNAAVQKANEFLKGQGIVSDPLIRRARVSSDTARLVYLQRVLPPHTAEKMLASLPLYYWQIDYSFEKKDSFAAFLKKRDQFLRVLVSPAKGTIIGFKRWAPSEEYAPGAPLPKEEVLAKAQRFFTATGIDISQFTMTRYSDIERKYILEWEKVIPEHPQAALKAHVAMPGGEVSSFVYFLNVPAQALEKFKAGSVFEFIIFIVLNALVLGFGIFVFIMSIVEIKHISWRHGLWFALLALLAQLITFLEAGEYRDIFLPIFIALTGATCIFYFLWTWIVWGSAQFFAKASAINLSPLATENSLLLSYLFTFSGLGVTLFFFSVIMKATQPVTVPGFYSFFSGFPSSPLSCIVPAFLSLGAAVGEELFFRALLISFLHKFIKKIAWCIVIASFVWSFIHLSPFGYDDIAPGFLKGIFLLPIGILFGYIFVRFGIVCAIATHYLYDLVVIGSTFLEFNDFRYAEVTIVTLLIAALMPLLIAMGIRLKSQVFR